MALAINMIYDTASITAAQNALKTVYPDTTIDIMKVFAQASQVWSNFITGAKNATGNTLDWKTDITVSFKDDGPTALGAAAPASVTGATLPTSGDLNMNLNPAGLKALFKSATDSNTFLDTVIHEIAHVLGYGTIWTNFGLVKSNPDGATTAVQGTYEYTGKNAVTAYQTLLNDKTITSVPVETTSGDGSAGSHWSATLFNGEMMLMAPKSGYGEPTPISTVTLASFADLGYVVNLANIAAYAGTYIDPSQQVTTTTAGSPTITSLGFSTLLPNQTDDKTPTARNPNITDDNVADSKFYKIVTYGTQPNGNTNGGTNAANGNDVIITKGDADQIYGLAGNDSISSGAGNDTISGGAGNDTIDGGSGVDTAVYTGNLANFKITKTPTQITIKDNVGTSGTDTLVNVEKLKFDDMTVNLSIQSNATTIPAATLKNIEELYVGFFKRVPDADGLSYWIDQFKAGKSVAQIADSFYDAGVQYGNVTGYSNTMTNDDFIKIVYANVLGRTGATAPPAADVAFWSNNITNGVATRGSMVNQMISSAHSYANDATWSWVDKLLNNKATVADNFAVQWGASYATPELSISKGMEIANAVTATDTVAAINLVGLSPVFA
jgi:hypothetical protein